MWANILIFTGGAIFGSGLTLVGVVWAMTLEQRRPKRETIREAMVSKGAMNNPYAAYLYTVGSSGAGSQNPKT